MSKKNRNKLFNTYAEGVAHYAKPLAVSPYTGTSKLVTKALGDAHSDGDKDMVSGAKMGVCAILTVIPVLPACTALTFGIALTGTVIAGLGVLAVGYPTALYLDSRSQEEEHQDDNNNNTKRVGL